MKGYKIVSFESLGTKSELLNFSDEKLFIQMKALF